MNTNINIEIMGRKLHLNKGEVNSCKKIICQFIDKVKDTAKTKVSPTYYFTFLIVMHHLSQELLSEMNEDSLEIVFNRLGKTEDTK